MKKILELVVSLTVISGVCAAVLAFVNGLTKGPIAEMKVRQERDAVMAVMPTGVTQVAPAGKCFVGKDAAGKVLGYAAKGLDPKGYGGDIVLMVGFAADRKTVVRYKTLAAAETPGLGMKLNTPEFADQFCGQDATALQLRKKGGKIDAITSATITSKAVIRAVKKAADALAEAQS